MTDKLVLVTGASGYIAAHVVQQLQLAGYRVRGTVRSISDENKIETLKNLAPGANYPIELVAATLDSDEGWEKAVSGCWAVIHTASPFPNIAETNPTDESVVRPAVDGTIRVLRAASTAGVKRVVLTSSFAAVNGEPTSEKDKVYTEADWTDPASPSVDRYCKSKTLAERAAWALHKELPDDNKFELIVINPTFVMGPPLLLSNKSSTSVGFVADMLTHKNPGVPKIMFFFCDVRDVAKAHLEALTNASAVGERHVIFSETMWLKDVARVLSDEFRGQGYRIPTWQFPYWAMYAASYVMTGLKNIMPRWGQETLLSNERMVKHLGINPTPLKTSLIDGAYAMIDMGIVPKTKNYKIVGSRANSDNSGEGPE